MIFVITDVGSTPYLPGAKSASDGLHWRAETEIPGIMQAWSKGVMEQKWAYFSLLLDFYLF